MQHRLRAQLKHWVRQREKSLPCPRKWMDLKYLRHLPLQRVQTLQQRRL
jgi:hypothetical protein